MRRILIGLIAVLLLSIVCQSAITLDTSTDATCVVGAADPIPCAYAADVTDGQLLTAQISWDGAQTITGVTDDLLQTWVLAKLQAGPGDEKIATYCFPDTAGGANTVNFNMSSAIAAQIVVQSWNGAALANCNSEPDNGADVDSTTQQAGNVTPNQANDLVVFGCRYATAFTIDTPPMDYNRSDDTTPLRLAAYYRIKTDATDENPAIVTAAMEVASCAISLFKEATTGGGGGPLLLRNGGN